MSSPGSTLLEVAGLQPAGLVIADRLQRMNESLLRKTRERDAHDRAVQETEARYRKILESSRTLESSQTLLRETALLRETVGRSEADRLARRNSAGRTAMQIAVDKDRENSHQAVVRVLQRSLSNVSFDASLALSEASTSGACRRTRAGPEGGECGGNAPPQSGDSVQRKVSFDEKSDGSLSDRSQISRHSKRSGHSADKQRGPGRGRHSSGLGGA